MKPIRITAAALAAILALTGCKHRRDEPVPGPRAGDPSPHRIARAYDAKAIPAATIRPPPMGL